MSTVHVSPLNDLLAHEIDGAGECPCLPVTEPVERDDGSVGWLIIHHAWDGRK